MTGNVIQPVRVRTGSYQIVLSTPDLGREKLQKGTASYKKANYKKANYKKARHLLIKGLK